MKDVKGGLDSFDLPSYAEIQRMDRAELLESLTTQATPNHLEGAKLTELATSRFREELDASRRTDYSGDLGTLALLGQANALRALRAEQAGFSRYYVNLALDEATESMLKFKPEEIHARMVIAAAGLGVAAVRHWRLGRREYDLRRQSFMARRSHRPDTAAIEAKHRRAVDAVAAQRMESNRARRIAGSAPAYMQWYREKVGRPLPLSTVKLFAARAALEIAAEEPHQATWIAREIPVLAHEVSVNIPTDEGQDAFELYWRQASGNLMRLARRYFLQDIFRHHPTQDVLGMHGRRLDTLGHILGDPINASDYPMTEHKQ